MLVPDQSGGVRDSSQPGCSFDFLAVRLLLALQGSLQVLLLLAWVFLLLAGEETLEVAGAFFVLSDSRPLARQLHLHRGRERVAPTHPLQALERIQRPNKCVFDGRLKGHRLAQHARRRKECSLFLVLHPFRREVAS